MFAKQSNGGIAATLVLAVLLWGANNAGTKFLVRDWPLVFLGATRLFAAGLLLLAILRWTKWLGPLTPLPRTTARRLWLHGGLCLAVYIVLFNFALKLTSASHVALYLGASPIWALLWEERPAPTWHSGRRYGSALLAVSGVVVLSWPSLRIGGWLGEPVCLTASVLWTAYSRQCRAFGGTLSGAEVSAHTLWRAGALLMPVAAAELAVRGGIPLRWDLVAVQAYCTIGGGVVAYALWNNGLRHWPTSKVFLFNNLIPIATMIWAWTCLGEPVTSTFWLAMGLVVAGVILGQGNWEKILGNRWWPAE